MPKTFPFNKHYVQYEEWFLENPYIYQSELLAVRHFIPSKGDGFEIGIGSGKFAEPLGLKIGVDPSIAMRKLASEKRLNVYNATAEKLPFKDGQFDYALMVTSICFVDDIDKSLREASRVLSNDGCMIIGFVDRTSHLGKAYEKNKKENGFWKIIGS
jgi:ubiquinone/menaquinone biosynthesis C-methylase UbiE